MFLTVFSSLVFFKSIHYVCVGTHHPAGLLFQVVRLFFFFDEGVHTAAPIAVDDLQYKWTSYTLQTCRRSITHPGKDITSIPKLRKRSEGLHSIHGSS